MDRVHATADEGVSAIQFVAVAVKSVGPDRRQRHAGIFHRDPTTREVMLLHLAWHHDLRNELTESNRWLWVDPPIPSRRARNVAAKCRQIWRANEHDRIPYGFSPPSDCFDAEAHEYLVGPSRHGLTCATFVLAVFAHAGLLLARIETWPLARDEDREWQQMIAQSLEASGADKAHVAAVRSGIGCARFRPEEVAAAATQAPPAEFPRIEALALEIVARLPE